MGYKQFLLKIRDNDIEVLLIEGTFIVFIFTNAFTLFDKIFLSLVKNAISSPAIFLTEIICNQILVMYVLVLSGCSGVLL